MTADRPEFDIAALLRDLDGVEIETHPAILRAKSRDFFWYSPVLREKLDAVRADLVAMPRDEAQVRQVARACVRHRVPLTVRGAGTGNYGQCMPLAGGLVLDMTRMDRIGPVTDGMLTAGAGARLRLIEEAARVEGWELRMFPSTLRTATIGGFVGGGSSGIGSVAFGMLSDRGSILGARVVTLEDEPQVIDLRSAEVNQVHHAYGTNGIITEVTIPLARAQPWVELAVAFDTLAALVRFCRDVAETSGIVTRLIAAHDAEVCGYLGKFPVPLPPGKAVGLLIVARQSLEPLNAWLTEQGGSIVYDRSEAQAAAAQAVPIYEFAWNHTTLHALRADRNVTYLQTLFPAPLDLDLVGAMAERFGDEVPMHLEFVRLGGHVACFGLQLVRYTTAERLDEIMAAYDAAGCPNFNPHTFVLEDGGMRQTDPVQLAFKQRTDPYGLMNPGKMRGWTPAGSVRA